jgi:DNA-binding transcriptional regulator YiaG
MGADQMLGTLLVAERAACHLSAGQLSERLGVSWLTVLQWQRTAVPPEWVPQVRAALAATQHDGEH